MRILHLFVAVVMGLMAQLVPASAQQALPDHRYVYEVDVDFYGADLGPLFEVPRSACARACDAQTACVGFTFNTLKNACFPKSDVTRSEFFEGAQSARKIVTPAQARSQAQARLAQATFVTESDLTAAHKLVQTNADTNLSLSVPLSDMLAAFDTAIARGDTVAAARWMGTSIAVTDRGDLWALMAWLGLRPDNPTARKLSRQLRRDAVPAALNAYLRAGTPDAQVDALDLLARALEANRRGRDMIVPLRLAAEIEPRAELQAALEKAIGKYGFRITDNRVDNNAARPRICAEFSEPLIQSGADYAPFVRLSDPTLAVEADGRSLCIDGVTHGNRYTATFRSGLPAQSGEVLHKDVTLTLYVRDRDPSARFVGRAHVLPRGGDAALPIETVNTDEVTLKLRRISDRNLLRAMQDSYFGKPFGKYEEDQFARTIAQDVWRGTGEVQNTLNTAMTTRLPLAEALEGQAPGIFALTAGIKGADPYDTPATTQWFILTDLGLSTMSGVDGLHVNVRGLGDAQGRSGVTLSLISQANAVLGEVVTDAQGRAKFPAGLTRGTGTDRPALLMASDASGDAAFLSLRDPAFDLSDRGVEGRAPAPAVDTFLTTDRGAYRVGEVIFATVLARDAEGKAIADLPLTARLSRPDGAEYTRKQSMDSVAGGHVFDIRIGADAPRGAWRLDILADDAQTPLATQTILVEDFLPDRIEFDLTLADSPVARTPLRVDARYLFGAPASDLVVEGEVRLHATRSLEAHPGYLFGRHDARFDARTAYLTPQRTNTHGSVELALNIPALAEPPSQPLQITATARIAEGSGRPVERRLTRALPPSASMIGIKKGFDGVLSEGAEAAFTLISTRGEMPVRYSFNRVETQYQWYRAGGSWAWEPITRRIRTAQAEVTLDTTPTALSFPTEWGRYELLVEQLEAPYAVSSVILSSGWYGGTGAVETPDYLALSLDRETYDVGDTAQLRIIAPQAGVAMISVLSNRVIEERSINVAQGETVIPLDVTDQWGSSAYVTASLIRPMDAQAGLSPARSLGIVHAAVAPAEKKLEVVLDIAPTLDGQAGKVDVGVRVTGIAAGDTAYVTLAAVDVGILNLTDFQPPDPAAHYFGQRRLGVGLRDVYGRLIDGMTGAIGRTRSGGDAAASAQIQSAPPTEALMAFFSGPVRLDAQGRVVIEMERPAFNGTIRLMAVAWTDAAVGNATRDITARDPVVITASAPRLLAPQDTSRLLVELTHTSGAAGEMALEIFADAQIAVGSVPAAVNLSENATLRLPIDLTAREVGDAEITVQLTTPDGVQLRSKLQLPVRINDPVTSITRQLTLAAGETFTFDADVLSGLRAGTASATLSSGPMARLNVPSLLRQLDRYPYGCTEQVTSAALPLLYLGDLARGAGIGSPQQIDKKVAQAIAQVLSRQASNGAFGLWRARSGALWLDAYVTDFLWQAQAQGHTVPPRALASAMDNLRNRVNFAPDFDKGGEDIAYALLVLARSGAAQMGDLRYYSDTKATAFATPTAAAQLGAALAAYGDPARADRMFGRARDLLTTSPDRTAWRDDFGSALRDRAAVLTLAAEARSDVIDLGALAQSLRATGRSFSTQEAANIALAAYALEDAGDVTALEVDGAAVTGTMVQHLSDSAPAQHVIRNNGTSATDLTLTTYGVPQSKTEAGGYGYALTRQHFTMDGAQISGPVAAGTRLITVLEVRPFEAMGARLMIDDPLPAGFEIDNPNLLDSASVKGLEWIKQPPTQNTEYRSDRFLAAVDHTTSEPFQLAYVVRAVSPGEYHHPAAIVTDMYRPEYRANTAATRLTVTP
ncbi:alpha-2-macroglobulin family protein [Sulfitobacter sp. HNIBRBA2951]|uniref:alpha-2-macroglobulin family protein n=1 Tax=Sulfitobacter aquimarinus TaxID=3158557 RepID=UPI0032DF8FA0